MIEQGNVSNMQVIQDVREGEVIQDVVLPK